MNFFFEKKVLPLSLFLFSLSSALHACSSPCLYDFDDDETLLLPNDDDNTNTNNHRCFDDDDDDDDDFDDVGVCPSFRDFDDDER